MLRREPTIDFQAAQERLGDAMTDTEVLALSAAEGRILISHDVNTLPKHFGHCVAGGQASPGVLVIPQSVPLARAIDELVLIWWASEAEEWHNLLVWLPL